MTFMFVDIDNNDLLVGLNFFIKIGVFVTNINWPIYNHSICNYMQLLIIYNYIWTFLQVFFVLVIFVTIVVFILP